MKHSRPDITVRVDPSSIAGMDRHIFDEEFFHYSISLERKRAERTHRSFLLILLDLNRVLLDQRNEEILDKIISSISTTVRETDITGWHRSNAVLGFVFTDIPTENRGSIVGALVSRVNGILYNCLGFGRFNQITVSHYVFPDEWDCDVPQRPSNPKLYPDIEKRNHGSKLYLATKRLTDIVGSAFGLALFAPLLLVIALAIKLTSRGPVFFRQQRIGQFGRPFVFLKFRSMYRDNDSRVHRDYVKQLISGKAERQPTKGNGKGVYKLTRDPRVTRVGEFLRRTSLDELPQLYNVLCGEMSLVGPRPAIPYEVEAYEIWHRRRVLEAKPGITGLWQVSGRSRVAFDEMVRLDVRYAVKRSLWMDIRILLLTPWAVIQGEGAH